MGRGGGGRTGVAGLFPSLFGRVGGFILYDGFELAFFRYRWSHYEVRVMSIGNAEFWLLTWNNWKLSSGDIFLNVI